MTHRDANRAFPVRRSGIVATVGKNAAANLVRMGAAWLAVLLLAGAAGAGGWFWLTRSRRPQAPPHRPAAMPAAEREGWRMPPVALLQPVTWSPGTKLGMALLRGYLVISVLLLVVKAVQLGGG